ncbi:MAG TPA: hypothetical protein VJA23_04625 [Candidatus Nanoarchaeia archaeon]|nr:hypothetical protein [Candidatus Nanoarchaeia archaeon]
MQNRKQIILDTNALMAIAEFKIDLITELEKAYDFPYELCVLEGTIKELKKIQEEQREKFKRAAKLALGIIKVKKITVLPSIGYVDTELIKHSRNGDLILTQDVELKKELSLPYLTIRQKKRVVLIG